jgi:hypothetical protein
VFPVEFSAPHGFYDAPVDLALSTSTVGADIRYTTDGTLPTETEGTVYTEPIRVSRTTTLRVAAFQPGKQPTAPVSHTLIFLDDVLTQTGSAFPAKWGSRPADYAMDPRIVDDAVYGAILP